MTFLFDDSVFRWQKALQFKRGGDHSELTIKRNSETDIRNESIANVQENQ